MTVWLGVLVGHLTVGGVSDSFACSWDPFPLTELSPSPDARVCASLIVICYDVFG